MNDTLTHITSGFQSAWRHVKLTFILYIVQLSMAIVIGFEVYQVMEASIGHSASVEDIIEGYNHTVLRDFINVHGASLSPLVGQMRWIILVYAIYSVFLHGGILNVLIKDGADWSDFWKGGAKYFRPFLFYALIFSTVFMLWTAIIWIPILGGLFPLIESMDRERPIFWIIFVVFIIWVLGTILVFALSLTSRYLYISENRSFWHALYLSRKRIMVSWKPHMAAIMTFILCIAVIYGANLLFELQIGIRSEFLILAFLFWQQLMVIVKVFLRVALLSSCVGILSSHVTK